MELLREGLTFDWKTNPPGLYREKNNKSAMVNLPQLRETVTKWEHEGFIERLDSPPLCCNPMTVAVQYNLASNSVKYRPCIDLSRHVNKHIADMGVKLDDLRVSEALISPNDYMTALDLENMYLNIRLRNDMKKYLGFMVPFPDGDRFFQFCVMPFGIKPAVAIVTRLLKPVKAYFHRLGIKFSIYIDDGRVSAASSELCSRHMVFVLDILQRVGWHIQWKKTVLSPTQSLLYQGFITDSIQMKYILPAEKWEKISESIVKVLAVAAAGETVEARELAGLLGRLIAIRRSHGSIVQVLSRSMQHQLGSVVLTEGWDANLLLSPSSVGELSLLHACLPQFNGHFIPTAAAVAFAYESRQLMASIEHIVYSSNSMENLLVSDASDHSAFIFLADGSFSYAAAFPVDSSASSSSRELDALVFALQRDAASFLSTGTHTIYWQTDSRVCERILLVGSRIPALQEKIFTLKRLEREFAVSIIPVWTPREHPRLQQADFGSRLATSSDEWSIDRRDLAELFVLLDCYPDFDGFAISSNAITSSFFSPCPQTGCAGVNFFTQQLSPAHFYFLCPPVSLISKTVAQLEMTQGIQALLLVPDWPSTVFWAVLHPGGRTHPMVQRVWRFKPRFYSSVGVKCLFTAGATVPFLALVCKT